MTPLAPIVLLATPPAKREGPSYPRFKAMQIGDRAYPAGDSLLTELRPSLIRPSASRADTMQAFNETYHTQSTMRYLPRKIVWRTRA